ncbi:MAG: hypothetical protein IIB68_10510 [Proteobacteria bacterium]|nr:hypothetical protein [Pseudomonadota bacterium]
MTTNNSTTTIDERLTQGELSDLRAIRRSSMAIESCAEIINEHHANEGGLPSEASVFIALNVEQVSGLGYAIEACANRITNIFDETALERVGFQDDLCPSVTREIQLHAELVAGTIPFDEFQRRAGGAS